VKRGDRELGFFSLLGHRACTIATSSSQILDREQPLIPLLSTTDPNLLKTMKNIIIIIITGFFHSLPSFLPSPPITQQPYPPYPSSITMTYYPLSLPSLLILILLPPSHYYFSSVSVLPPAAPLATMMMHHLEESRTCDER